jgi:hypothetical protein
MPGEIYMQGLHHPKAAMFGSSNAPLSCQQQAPGSASFHNTGWPLSDWRRLLQQPLPGQQAQAPLLCGALLLQQSHCHQLKTALTGFCRVCWRQLQDTKNDINLVSWLGTLFGASRGP